MKNAIWYGRFDIVEAQKREIAKRGFHLVLIPRIEEMGEREIRTRLELTADVSDLLAIAKEHDLCAVFGIFPTPLQAVMCLGDNKEGVPCYAPWKVFNPKPGDPHGFIHRKFCCVGCLSENSINLCREV